MFKLIGIWIDDTVKAQLEGCRRNSDVYRKITKELIEASQTRTLKQCGDKLKKLKAERSKISATRLDKFVPQIEISLILWITCLGISQPPVVVDSGNQSDGLQSQWSPEIIENPSSNRCVSTSDDGVASGLMSTEQSMDSHQTCHHKLQEQLS